MTPVTAVITSVPWTDTDSPLMAPGVLKSCLGEHGISSVALDLNQEINHRLRKVSDIESIKNFFRIESVDASSIQEIKALHEYMADRILSHNPEWVFLSLLTYFSQTSCKWLCFILKKRNPNIKIVIGGPGAFSTLKSIDSYAAGLKRKGLIDHYISGDGEKSAVALLQGNTTYPGIDSMLWQELENLDQLPTPDFDDYDFDLYLTRSTPIWGSRGCVRKCTFCDIHEHWSKFQWRSAENIFEEIKRQYQRYKINTFNFADSLINGNQKEYKKLIRLLAEFNRDKADEDRIKWTSFFIFRPKNAMTDEDWRLTAESGAILLKVGVENFVEHIRTHIKKHFTNDDLDWSLKSAQKYKIPLVLLIIIGYATETDEDHQEQLRWIRENKHYANDSIYTVRIGNTLSVLPGTWLYRNKEKLNLELGIDDAYQTWTRKDINNTPQVRLQRHQEIQQALKENGFKVSYTEDSHVFIEEYVKNYVLKK
jgi:radical SAM superfamily enzyme YgiQ (UPF0313 family)